MDRNCWSCKHQGRSVPGSDCQKCLDDIWQNRQDDTAPRFIHWELKEDTKDE